MESKGQGPLPKKRGRKPKLSPEQIEEVREMYSNKTDPIGWSVPAIARVMGVSGATIHKALNQQR